MLDDKHFRGDHEASPSGESSPPPAVVSPLPRADPRQRMLNAMVSTVARRGYERTTLSRLLTHAQLPEAAFEEHFHDKRDCFLQAVDQLIAGAERAALEEFHAPGAWHEHVRRCLRRLLESLASSEDAARVVFVEMLSAGSSARERQRIALELFTSLIEEGRSHNRDADGLPTQMSEAIVGGIASILHCRVLQGEASALPSLLGDLTYFALLPYLGAERAMREAGLRRAA